MSVLYISLCKIMNLPTLINWVLKPSIQVIKSCGSGYNYSNRALTQTFVLGLGECYILKQMFVSYFICSNGTVCLQL